MTLFVILEGQEGCGKSFIGKKLNDYFNDKGYVSTFFDESSIIKSCMNGDTIGVYDIYGVREQEYMNLKHTHDIIFIEKSFITNVVYHLPRAMEYLIDEFIENELQHYSLYGDSCQIYTLFRDYKNEIVDIFLGVSHYLLETYEIDINCLPNSQDDKTENLLNHIIQRIEWELES